MSMTKTQLSAGLVERAVPNPPDHNDVAKRVGSFGRVVNWAGQTIPTLIATGCLVGLVALGTSTNWRMPKFSAMLGNHSLSKDDWCEAHSVPESICVECRPESMPRMPTQGWCRKHGVHECPNCHPEIAQLTSQPVVTDADHARAADGLAFAPRTENNVKCKIHERRIQVASNEVLARLGIDVKPAVQAPITEFLTVIGEITYDPTRIARLSPRVPGTVIHVYKQVGDKVYQGDVLALVESADVGKAKSEFQQALVNLELRKQMLAGYKSSPGSVPFKNIQEADAAVQEAQIRLLTAEQALLNLGLPVKSEELRALAPAELIRQMQFLGIPESIVKQLRNQTTSSNLIAVNSPIEGEVVQRSTTQGEAADTTKPMFVVADLSRLWLTLRAKLEDANRIQPGQEVRFQHAGHSGWDSGVVTWISPSADEKTRAVPVRVELPNAAGRHHVNTFGAAHVILRVEPKATVVPSSAVHWEGDCNVVFVRDRDFDKPNGPKVFHVRKVRPGAQDASAQGDRTEILAGLLPGEQVATTNSGIFRTELLKNNLGAG